MITIRVWSIQKANTLLKLVTFRLEDLKLTWNDIVAITTDGAKVLCWGGYSYLFFQVPNWFYCVNSFLLILKMINTTFALWRYYVAIELCRVQNKSLTTNVCTKLNKNGLSNGNSRLAKIIADNQLKAHFCNKSVTSNILESTFQVTAPLNGNYPLVSKKLPAPSIS